MGYILKEQLVADQEEIIRKKKPVAKFVPKQPISGKINLTWEHLELDSFDARTEAIK